MKKRVGTYKGRPIVETTYNNKVNKKDIIKKIDDTGKISFLIRGSNGKLEVIAESKLTPIKINLKDDFPIEGGDYIVKYEQYHSVNYENSFIYTDEKSNPYKTIYLDDSKDTYIIYVDLNTVTVVKIKNSGYFKYYLITGGWTKYSSAMIRNYDRSSSSVAYPINNYVINNYNAGDYYIDDLNYYNSGRVKKLINSLTPTSYEIRDKLAKELDTNVYNKIFYFTGSGLSNYATSRRDNADTSAFMLKPRYCALWRI